MKKPKIIKFVIFIFHFTIKTKRTIFDKLFRLLKKSIKKANENPDYLISDYTKFEDNDTIHIAFQALNNFINEHGRLPNSWDKNDSEKFVHLSHNFNLLLEKPFSNLNENLLKLFSNVCRGSFCPLQSGRISLLINNFT